MVDSVEAPITVWLARWRAGEHEALDQIVPPLYRELRQAARRQLSREATPHTLTPTALVHEVYLRLLQQRHLGADDRDAFLQVASHTMRRVLVDHARRRLRLKRGGTDRPSSIDDRDDLPDNAADVHRILAIDGLLERLAALDRRAAQVVEYRVFAGLTLEETATALATSTKTVQRTWNTARAWLRKELATEDVQVQPQTTRS